MELFFDKETGCIAQFADPDTVDDPRYERIPLPKPEGNDWQWKGKKWVQIASTEPDVVETEK